MKKQRKLGRWAIVILLVIVGWSGAFRPAEATEEELFTALQANRFETPIDAPDFTLPLLGGDEAKLSDYKGNVVFLNFWATWCPYCRQEREALQATYNKYKDQGFVLLSVSIDRTDPESVQKYLTEHKLTFPNFHDRNNTVAGEYGVRGVPATYFIDRQGKVLGGVIGPRPWDSKEVHALIEAFLQAK